jgi:hypothetical protein
MKVRNTLSLALVLSFLCPLLLSAQTFSGRLNTTFYTWDRIDGRLLSPDEYARTTHFRGYQTFRFGVTHGDISLRTYGQIATDFNTTLADDPVARLYDLHLRWRNIGGFLDVSAGRQPIFAGVGRGTIDGGTLRLRFREGKYEIFAYAGSLVLPFESNKVQDFSDRRMLGGQIVLRPVQGLYTSFSFMDRHNKREQYIASRADSILNPIQVLIDGDSREFQLASADISYLLANRMHLYGRFDYNVDDSKPQRMEVWTRYNITSSLAITAEYLYREPLVPFNSIFKMFEVESNQEVEGGIEYRFDENVTFTARGGVVLYDDDNSLKLSLGILSKFATVSISHTGGYAGDLISFSAMRYSPIRKDQWTLAAGLGFASYKPADSQANNELALSGLLGVSHKVGRSLSFDLQAQILTNRVYDYDSRVFFRVNYWFFQQNLGIF